MELKKRYLALYVKNRIGVLANITSMFSDALCNIDNLTVGATEKNDVTHITVGVTANDDTLNNIKTLLQKSNDIIKVTDLSEVRVHKKEIMFIRINDCEENEKAEIFHLCESNNIKVIDCGKVDVLLICVRSEYENSEIAHIFTQLYGDKAHIIHGGGVAVEAIPATQKLTSDVWKSNDITLAQSDMILHHICVQTNCYDESLAFYKKTLNMSIVTETSNFHERAYNTWLKNKNILIELQTPRNDSTFDQADDNHTGLAHICFYTQDLDAKYDELFSRGIDSFMLRDGNVMRTVNDVRFFKLRAPEGTIIEFRDKKSF